MRNSFSFVHLITTTLVLVFTGMALYAQPSFILTREQALEDLQIFRTSLHEIHPDIYRYTPRADFDKAFIEVERSVSNGIDNKIFYAKLSRIIAMVRCGHTFGIVSFIDAQKGILPIDIRIVNNRIFVIRNFSPDNTLIPGAEILSINGSTASSVLTTLRDHSVADGYGLNFKDRTIEDGNFKWKYATFIGQPDSFRIEFKDGDSTHAALSRTTVLAMPADSISRRFNNMHLPVVKPLAFRIDREHNVAVLKLGSFVPQMIRKQSGQRLRKTITRSFRKLKKEKVDNLVIDIRGNTGGKVSVPPFLFSHLTDRAFRFRSKLLYRHGYHFTYPQYLNRSKLSDWVNKKLDRKINDTTYEWTLHTNTKKLYRPKKNAFRGNLFIVANGMTASAGAEFAALVKVYGHGVFVGEETGGDFNGVNAFERTYLQLPNSKVGVLIAGWRSVMPWPEDNPGRGVLRTYEVHPTIEDILAGEDTEMKFVYKLIRDTGSVREAPVNKSE